MEKEFGRIKKNDSTEIIVRIDEYKGKKGLTIREFVTSERYTGFSKAGTRIPGNSFIEFRDLINQIDYNDLINEEVVKKVSSKEKKPVKEKKPRKKKEDVIDKIVEEGKEEAGEEEEKEIEEVEKEEIEEKVEEPLED